MIMFYFIYQRFNPVDHALCVSEGIKCFASCTKYIHKNQQQHQLLCSIHEKVELFEKNTILQEPS